MQTFGNSGATDSSRSYAITTLGCKVNRFESELLTQSLQNKGWLRASAETDADLHIINTCTVTREADRQARQLVRRLVKQNPGAMIVVTGCYAQMAPGECADIPGVDFVIGNDRKLDIADMMPVLESGSASRIMVGDMDRHVSLPDSLLSGYDGQTRAYVQIQQGCDQGCTFCIIHRARGPSRSLPATLIRRQVERLVIAGYREIVLCGVDLGSFGMDLGTTGDDQPYDLGTLIHELDRLPGDFRIRLSSIDPAHLTPRFIEILATSDRVCPHLHLSLQSGNTLILKRMKRRYTAEQVYEVIGDLRREMPRLVLSADVMVGFPTETHSQFEDSVRMVQKLEIAYPHVFPYSGRKGTPAYRIPSDRQVPKQVRRQRAERLRETGRGVRQALLASKLGLRERVLVEGPSKSDPGFLRARAADYVECRLEAAALAPGSWAEVEYEALRGEHLIARDTA